MIRYNLVNFILTFKIITEEKGLKVIIYKKNE